tara:strand:+ start:193 stop:924 length:732 start_codon:yes stop_codon:yes gene_type:complete
MGGQNTTTSSASSGGGSNNNNNNQATQIAKQVKKDIGLTAVGGLGGQNQGYIAANAPDPLMYGGAASTAAKKRMEEAGMGTYNPQTGSFQNVVGNQIISGTGAVMGGAMGTGEQTVMGQIPISQKMFEQQKKLQMIATGAMALTGIPLMGAAYLDARKKKYDDYVSSFNNIIKSPTTSYGMSNNQSAQKVTDTQAAAETGESSFVETAAERSKRMAAISRRNEALKGKRSFFSGVKQTIAGQL